VRGRHVSDPAEARAGAHWINHKYGATLQASADGEPLTPAEQATFELTPESDENSESAASTS
jgi:hypothetical protein